MKSVVYLIFMMVFLLTACTAVNPTSAPPQPEVAPRIELTDCKLSASGVTRQISAECGKLSVPENYSLPDGKKIELNLAVFRAVSRNSAPDPLFFLTGGPGQAATESFLTLAGAFDLVHQKRDIVLVDQRGTGKSNPLACPVVDNLEAGEHGLLDAVKNCLEALKDSDLTQYTTTVAMQDLDAVRAALGYEQINLYGVSYGSRAAQTYLKMYPERVRSVVLDGVVPQEEPLGLYVAQDAQRALDLIFARCLVDLDCNRTFPGIRQEFEALLRKLESTPQEVSLTDPRNGEPITIKLSNSEVASTVRLLSYSPETAALIPLLIRDAVAQNDLSRLAAQYLIVAGQLNETISDGMSFSVLCAEDLPFIDPMKAAALNDGTYMGDIQTDQLMEICSIWPHGEVTEAFKKRVEADTPTLLLSGEADPVTPPSKAEQVAQGLPNSLSIIAPGQGHNVVFRGCIPWLMSEFFESASVENLDTSCVQEIGPMPLFLNFSGPVPEGD